MMNQIYFYWLLMTQTHCKVWQSDISPDYKRNERSQHSSKQCSGPGGEKLWAITQDDLWHVHCSERKYIFYPLQKNMLEDTCVSFNWWHRLVVAFHTRLKDVKWSLSFPTQQQWGEFNMSTFWLNFLLQPFWLMVNFVLMMLHSRRIVHTCWDVAGCCWSSGSL